MRALLFPLLLTGALAGAAPNSDLEKAAQAIGDAKYALALVLLDSVAKSPELDRQSVLQLYELRGTALAMGKQEAKAKAAFQSMLWLAPDAQLGANVDGKVMKAFRAAKDWAKSAPPLEFRAEPAATDDRGRVMQIAAFLKADPMKLVRKVRFHLKANGGGWGTAEEQVQASYAATATEAEGVEWWAELLGDKQCVLSTLGSEEQPVLEGKAKASKKPPPKPVAKADPKKDPKAAPADAPVVEPAADETATPKTADAAVEQPVGKPFVVTAARGAGFALLGGGAVCGIIGVVLGAASAGTRANLSAQTPDDTGVVRTMTQKTAFELEASANGMAAAANVLYVTAGVLAGVGVVLVVAGGPADDAPKVSLAPAGLGAVLSGTLP